MNAAFEGDFKLKFHLAPPLLAPKDPVTGELRKREYGPWVFKAFGMLTKLKFLRGTPFDPFGYTGERKTERQLIADYEATIESLLQTLTPQNQDLAIEIASIPEQIRGYGHVKEASITCARARQEELVCRLS